MLKMLASVTVVVLFAATVIAVTQALAQHLNEDAPKTPGACAVYHTHTHGDGSRDYQLTCAAPVPDSIMVRLLR